LRGLGSEKSQAVGEGFAHLVESDRTYTRHRPQFREHREDGFRLTDRDRSEPLQLIQPLTPRCAFTKIVEESDHGKRNSFDILQTGQVLFNAGAIGFLFRAEFLDSFPKLLFKTVEAANPSVIAADDSGIY